MSLYNLFVHYWLSTPMRLSWRVDTEVMDTEVVNTEVVDTEVMITVVTENEVTDHKTADSENNLLETVDTKSDDLKKIINFGNPLLFILEQLKLLHIGNPFSSKPSYFGIPNDILALPMDQLTGGLFIHNETN